MMTMRVSVVVGAAVLMGGSLLASGLALREARRGHELRAEPGHPAVYRLDFALASDGGSGDAPTKNAYSLTLEERNAGTIVTGENVPLQPGAAPSPRQDVGVKIKCEYHVVDGRLLVHDALEMSSATAPAIEKLVAQGDAVVTPGHETQVALVEDPTSHRRVRLTVTATKVL